MDLLSMPGSMNLPGMILTEKMIRIQGYEKTLQDIRKVSEDKRVMDYLEQNAHIVDFEKVWDESIRSAEKVLKIIDVMES